MSCRFCLDWGVFVQGILGRTVANGFETSQGGAEVCEEGQEVVVSCDAKQLVSPLQFLLGWWDSGLWLRPDREALLFCEGHLGGPLLRLVREALARSSLPLHRHL